MTPDGRALPRTLLELLGGRMDLVRRLYEGPSGISRPRHLLAIPRDQVRFVEGIGTRREAEIGELCESAGFPLGCCSLEVKPPSAFDPGPRGRRSKRRRAPDFEDWTTEEIDAWGEHGCLQDDHGVPLRPGFPRTTTPGNLSTIPVEADLLEAVAR